MLVRAIFADPKMNATEMAYARSVLEPRFIAREIQWWGFECLKLRLADNTHYTPDFLIIFSDGRLEAHDTKALWKPSKKALAKDPTAKARPGWKEDARIKIKVAAGMYPWITFRGVHLDRQGWVEELFCARDLPRVALTGEGE